MAIFLYLVSKIAINIEGWLKICPSYLVYNQIWLNFLRDNHHFFSIFQWMIARFLNIFQWMVGTCFLSPLFLHLSYGWMKVTFFYILSLWMITTFSVHLPMDNHHVSYILPMGDCHSLFPYGWSPLFLHLGLAQQNGFSPVYLFAQVACWGW
jgi:hypothetical protein